jgi:hypothetical protein
VWVRALELAVPEDHLYRNTDYGLWWVSNYVVKRVRSITRTLTGGFERDPYLEIPDVDLNRPLVPLPEMSGTRLSEICQQAWREVEGNPPPDGEFYRKHGGGRHQKARKKPGKGSRKHSRGFVDQSLPLELSRAYRLLYMHPDAPMEVVKAAYRALSRIVHPDLGGSSEKMKALNAAFEAIKRHRR